MHNLLASGVRVCSPLLAGRRHRERSANNFRAGYRITRATGESKPNTSRLDDAKFDTRAGRRKHVAELYAILTPWFAEEGSAVHERTLALSHPEVATLVGMGPNAWHTAPEVLASRVARLPEPVRVSARIRVSHYSQVALRC